MLTSLLFWNRVFRFQQNKKCPLGTYSKAIKILPLSPGHGLVPFVLIGKWSNMKSSSTSSCITHTPNPSHGATTSSPCPFLQRRRRKSLPHLSLRNQKESQESSQTRENMPWMMRRRQKAGRESQSQAQGLMWVVDALCKTWNSLLEHLTLHSALLATFRNCPPPGDLGCNKGNE